MIYGVDEARETAIEYIKKWTLEDPPRGDAYTISLYLENSVSGSTDPIQNFTFTLDEDKEGLADDIATTAEKAAEEAGPGGASFVMRLEGNKRAQKRFTLENGPGEGDDDFSSGYVPRPNERGVIGLLMRHTEAATRQAFAGQHDVLKILRAELNESRERIRVLERERVRYLQVFEEIMSHQHERDAEERRVERSEARRDHLTQSAIAVMPVALNQLVKKLTNGKAVLPTVPGVTTAIEAMVSSLTKSLSPEELEVLQKNIRPENQLLIFEIFKASQDAEEARKIAGAGNAAGEHHVNGVSEENENHPNPGEAGV